ncbi:MAG: pirin family protein [Rhodanobacteraceae bacterium]
MDTLVANGTRRVERVVRGRPGSDGAGVKLTRVIGQPDLDMLDPFLLLDEFSSDDAADYVAGFPDHPHRGFETVTYMLAGRMRHRDNQGNSGLLTAGSVQWMTAGRGIVHSEMPEQDEGRMAGFQLWVNLPAADKMTDPRYQDIAPERIPEVDVSDGVRVRVIAGQLGDATGPVDAPAIDAIYWDVHLAPGAHFEAPLPEGHNAFVYVYQGSIKVGPDDATRDLEQRELGVLGRGVELALTAGSEPTRALVVAGRPLREPVARHGPFVMNTPEQIVEAFRDFQSGRF